jgi:hypothetical protein
VTLLVVVSLSLIAVAVARRAWRFHLRALEVLGPGLATRAGTRGVATMAEVVSVLVEAETVVVALRGRPAQSDHNGGTAAPEPVSTIVVSVAGHGCSPVARLQRWEASGATVLVAHDECDGTIEFRQLHTGQHLRLPVVSGSKAGWGPGVGHPGRRHAATT